MGARSSSNGGKEVCFLFCWWASGVCPRDLDAWLLGLDSPELCFVSPLDMWAVDGRRRLFCDVMMWSIRCDVCSIFSSTSPYGGHPNIIFQAHVILVCLLESRSPVVLFYMISIYLGTEYFKIMTSVRCNAKSVKAF